VSSANVVTCSLVASRATEPGMVGVRDLAEPGAGQGGSATSGGLTVLSLSAQLRSCYISRFCARQKGRFLRTQCWEKTELWFMLIV
jgi:hypothetical protein